MMTTETYRRMMQEAAATHTIDELDWTNKQMLGDKQITVDQYLMVARALVRSKLWGKPVTI